jgi:flagellar motility protein MotE (MotC chaperone)
MNKHRAFAIRYTFRACLTLATLLAASPALAMNVPMPVPRPAELTVKAPAPEPAAGDPGYTAVEQRAMSEETRQYCVNITNAAADARFAWQTATLQNLQLQVEESVAALETKRAEYETWLARREKFLNQAKEDVVAIYSRMRPDAAAVQLAAMDDETAAAVLAKLKARNSSAILNEMDPARAAQLTNTLAGAAGLPTKGEKL